MRYKQQKFKSLIVYLTILFTWSLAPQPAVADGVKALQHMGPTGIWGYIASKRSFVVKLVDKGSPADGKLMPGDIVVGAGRMPFLKRVRFELAAAIADARTTKKKGKLVLMVRRKVGGKKMQRITLQLGMVGAKTFSKTAPYDCPKTDALIKDAAEYIVKKKDFGYLSIGLMGLLATGEDKYIKFVGEQLRQAPWAKAQKSIDGTNGYTSWRWGNQMIILTEYYLLSGDKFVLPAIRMYADAIVYGQDEAGLWGHRMKNPNTNRAFGYGVMNQPSLPVFIGLILARKCGVDSPKISAAIDKTHQLYSRKYINKGCLPYGNGGPNNQAYNNNGTSGSLAVAFSILGNVEGAKFFARMSMAAYNDIEMGHASTFFNPYWTRLGANLGGPEAAAAYFKKTGWYHTIKANWAGGYNFEYKKGIPGNHVGLGNSGSHLLALASGRNKLYITGKGRDKGILLSPKEVDETINVHKYLNNVKHMSIKELFVTVDTHWSPKFRRLAAWTLLKFKRDELFTFIQERRKKNPNSFTGLDRYWDKNPKVFDEVAAILRDKKADLDARCNAAGVLGGSAWARYVEPEEKFGRKEFYDDGNLHLPSLKYFTDLLHVIIEDANDDPYQHLLQAAGGALAGLGDPYQQNLIKDKTLFYKAINKMLACKHSAGSRTTAMKMISEHMPIEDFHFVADNVVHATRAIDRSYTSYRGDNCPELGAKLLWRFNIAEAPAILLDSFPTATRGKERARRVALFESFGANAKPYLPRLMKALEKNFGGTKEENKAAKDYKNNKDHNLSKAEVLKFIETIKSAKNPRKTISLKQAIEIGQKVN